MSTFLFTTAAATAPSQYSVEDPSVVLVVFSFIGLALILASGVYGVHVVLKWMEQEQIKTIPIVEVFIGTLAFMFGYIIVLIHLPYVIYKKWLAKAPESN